MRPRVPFRSAILAGALASGPALLVLVAGRLLLDAPGLLETVADGTLRYVPLPAFDAAIGAFGPGAKGALAVVIAVGTVLAGGGLALLVLRIAEPRSIAATGAVAAGVVLLVVEAIVLPVAGAGMLGTDATADPFALQVPIVVAALAYGMALAGLASTWPTQAAAAAAAAMVGAADAGARGAPSAETPDTGVPDPSRRTVLRRGLIALGGLSLVGSFGVVIARASSAARSAATTAPEASPGDPFGPTPALTPVPAFYTVSKNLGSPHVDGSAWRLSVGGLVDHPFSLSLDDLRALPSQEAYRTLMCISDDILAGDHYIGNQRWRGFPVADLLDRAGVSQAARFVLWDAEDGYTESLPIEVARDPGTWIVHEMGGKPLEADHGFPARVLIADRFGMKGPKWLRRITLSATDAPGYWEQNGWDETARERIVSRIDSPHAGDTVPVAAPFPVTGIAFAGARGIARVEVSADGGATWTDARLEDASAAPLGPLTWVRFRAQTTAPAAGRSALVVRATDGQGTLQVEEPTPPLPAGATGWQHVEVVAG